MKEYLTTAQIAKYCKLCIPSIRKLIKKGLIKGYMSPGGNIRKGRLYAKREDVIKYLKKNDLAIPKELYEKENPNYRILIIEDEYGVVESIKMVIKLLSEKIDEKIEVEIAMDGLQAGLKIYEFKPHIITLDCELPGLDGDKVLENLRANNAFKDIKVVVITAHDRYIPSVKRLKADAILMKPFNDTDLEKTICKLLNIKFLPLRSSTT